MRTGVLLALCFIVGLAARDLDFILEYRGECAEVGHAVAKCQLKATPIEFITKIGTKGEVSLEVNHVVFPGSAFSEMVFEDRIFPNGSYASHGHLSFGLHKYHKDHTLIFENLNLGRSSHSPDPTAIIPIAGSWNVTSGTGEYSGAFGVMTFNGIFNVKSKEAVIGVVGIIWTDAKLAEMKLEAMNSLDN
eukprot:TRINITY_DN18067_c0_g1_i1.p1 TRINITY_DN18067_c0_g1~~TRINITY_DN18067_c0_g1_i1.p1  ORF type:complete len:190 (-),score=19.40 TRINITY_DN18067_c0_g1_i1:58-627(-)